MVGKFVMFLNNEVVLDVLMIFKNLKVIGLMRIFFIDIEW